MHNRLSGFPDFLHRQSSSFADPWAAACSWKIQLQHDPVPLIVVVCDGKWLQPAHHRPHTVSGASVVVAQKEAAAVLLAPNPPDSHFVGFIQEVLEALSFYLLPLSFVHVRRLHPAAGAAVLALKPYRIGENDVLIVQGECRMKKTAYLRCYKNGSIVKA